MAGRGPAPKDPSERRRRNKETRTEVPAQVADKLGPELPGEHLPQTVAWYETWRSTPMAVRFQATDWQRLHMLAVVVDQFYTTGQASLMTEIRLNESLLGATEVDRQRLRLDIKREPEPKPAAAPAGRPRLKVV